MHKQNLITIQQFILNILSRNKILTLIKGRNSVFCWTLSSANIHTHKNKQTVRIIMQICKVSWQRRLLVLSSVNWTGKMGQCKSPSDDSQQNGNYRFHSMFQNTNSKWASSWDYGTYHIGNQRRFRLLRSLARTFAVCTHKVWKQTKGPTKNQTSSPTGWLTAHVCLKNEFHRGRKVP